MRGDHHTARPLDGGDDLVRRRRRRGNVILGFGAHRVGERVGTRLVHARRDQRVGNVRTAIVVRSPSFTWASTSSHVIGKSCDSRSTMRFVRRNRAARVLANMLEICSLDGSYWKASMCTDTSSSTAVISRAQRATANRFPPRLPSPRPSRRWCHGRQSPHHASQASLPAPPACAASPYRRKRRYGNEYPNLVRVVLRVTHVTHMTIVSSNPRFFA